MCIRDSCGRVSEVREELDCLLSVEDEACKLTDLYEAGELPLRVTHNDTKINNVLFDEETLKPLVVIDLDLSLIHICAASRSPMRKLHPSRACHPTRWTWAAA